MEWLVGDSEPAVAMRRQWSGWWVLRACSSYEEAVEWLVGDSEPAAAMRRLWSGWWVTQSLQ